VKDKPLAALDAQPLASKVDPETRADVRTLMTALGFLERTGSGRSHRWDCRPGWSRRPIEAIRFWRMNRSGLRAESFLLTPPEIERLPGVSRAVWMNETARIGARFTADGVRSFQHIAALLARKFR